MVFDGITYGLFGAKQGRPVAVKIIAEVIDHLNEFISLTGFIEEVVKFGMELDDFIIVSALQGFLRFYNFFLKMRDLFWGDMKGGKKNGVAFEGTPDAEDFLHILFRKFPDGKTSLWESSDQLITLQSVESLPHRGTTDPNLMSQ